MPTLYQTSLILGGARSGKSRIAERLVEQSGLDKVYLATGQAWDHEMATRIQTHRRRRGPDWTTIEEPLAICERLGIEASRRRAIVLDCLTLWLSNLLHHERNIECEIQKLTATLREIDGTVVLVSNEVGLGIVPDNALAREFRDHHGVLNQRVAEAADHVAFVAAGQALTLKPKA